MLWSKLITEFCEIKDLNSKNAVMVLNHGGEIIRNGGLVAFPTETVYGLGANALDPVAVKKIYEAKGRPSDNPLIVHISHISELEQIVAEVSEKAEKLIDAFWPGPLTLIFKKKSCVPDETTGGLDSVAVRFPVNEVARAFIKASGVPVAAPSANSSGKPSPTRASHVQFDLDGKINMIIDGGACEFGLESTIVDVSTDEICLLRPGSVTKEMVEKVIGKISVDKAVLSSLDKGETPKAPGMKYKHYSPKANVMIICGEADMVCEEINALCKEAEKDNKKACVFATEETKDKYNTENIIVLGKREEPESIGANLFKALRKCDFLGYDVVFSEGFEESEVGLAIMNRLKKAAGYHIVKV